MSLENEAVDDDRVAEEAPPSAPPDIPPGGDPTGGGASTPIEPIEPAPDPRIAELESQRDAMATAWASEKARDAIVAALDGWAFVGSDEATRDQAFRDFMAAVAPDVEAARTADGSWTVKAKDGQSVRDFVQASARRRAYLFVARGQGGAGSAGGGVPPAVDRPGSLRSIAQRFAAQRAEMFRPN